MGTTDRRTKRIIWRASVVLALALIILIVRLQEHIGVDRGPEGRFVVVRISDGDSMELRGGDRLRLLAVDTPERGEPLYDEATDFLKSRALNRPAELVFSGARRDKYGRLLAYLYIDSVCVNEQILRNGLGYLYLFKDTDRDSPQLRKMFAAQKEAMSAGIGLWGITHSPEKYYVARKGAFRLHRPGCRSIGEVTPDKYLIFDSRNQGLALGLSPCRNCKP